MVRNFSFCELLTLIWAAPSEFGTYRLCEHLRSLARTFAARSYRQWVKRNLQTESQIPGPSECLGMRSWNLSWRNARRHKFAWRGPYDENIYSIDIGLVTRFASSLICLVVAVLKIIMLLCLYSCKAEKMEIKWSLIVIGIALFIAGTYEPRHNKTYKNDLCIQRRLRSDWMPSLIWIFTGCTGHFVLLRLILYCFPYFFMPDCTFRSYGCILFLHSSYTHCVNPEYCSNFNGIILPLATIEGHSRVSDRWEYRRFVQRINIINYGNCRIEIVFKF